MHSAKRIGLIVGSAVVAAAVVLCVAFVIDTAGDGDRVRRNVALAGVEIGGLDRAQLDARLTDLAVQYQGTSVVVGDETRFSIPAAGIKLTMNQSATAGAALETGRSGNFAGRVVNWTKSFVRPQPVAVKVSYDDAALRESVRAGDPSERTEPVEPGFAVEDGRLRAVEGTEGKGIDATRVGAKLDDAATLGTPLQVEVAAGSIEPRFNVAQAQALADRMENGVVTPLPAKAGGTQKPIPPEAIRSWLRTRAGNTELEVAVDQESLQKNLEEMFASAGSKPKEATFDVVADRPVVIEGANGAGCCSPEAVNATTDALQQRIGGQPGPSLVELPLKTIEPDNTGDELRRMNVTQPIASFTTAYQGGQPRVTNIHRIADITRGSIIKPGATFSINNSVGRRTEQKGFVVDGVIQDGEFQEAVGGGISQYATTLFNAAFFGGLDFGEYQAHTIYINRYPYGREATVAFPNPDLEIKNTTPNGVLIWPSYTGNTVTVTLYSSPYATGEQTGQSQAQVGACTKVTTQRTRSYVDGRRSNDSVEALYQPEEGKKC